MVGYDSQKAELDALKSGEIDMVFHFDQSPNLAEEYRVACTNTTWTSNMMAVTNKQHFNENQANRVAVPQNKLSLTRYLAVYYPQWEIVDCAAQEDAARLVESGQADCFVTGTGSEGTYNKKYDFLQRSADKSCQILLCGQQRKRHPAVHTEQNDQGHADQYAHRLSGNV